jgi:hypothetical protein
VQNSAGQCPIAPDARAALAGVLDTARRNPVHGKDGRDATAGWIFTAVVSSLYTQASWSQLATGIADLAKGDPDKIFELADQYAERDSSGHYSNLFDANAAVNCTDTDEKISIAQVRALQSQWRTKYPLFRAPSAIDLLTCAQWPGATGTRPGRRGRAADRGGRHDRRPGDAVRATPKLADMLGVGVVLTRNGEGTPRTRRRAASPRRSTRTWWSGRRRRTTCPAS